MGITFNGAYVGLPGAYYADSVVAATPNNPPTTPPLLLVAYAWGPKPKTAVTFTNPGDLLRAFRGAPGAAFVPFLANPSPLLAGAQLVTLIDPSENTQSNLSLGPNSGTTQTLLTSTLYGPPSNQLTGQVSAGSVAGLKLTLTDNYGGAQFVGDNLTVPFQLAYSGAVSGVAASYTVTSGSFSVSGESAADTFTISTVSGAYTTVAQLVEYLNGTGYYFAESLSSTGGQLPASSLTVTGSVALPAVSGGVLQQVYVRAYLQDIGFWVNQFAQGIATAVVSGIADTAANLPATGVATFFSGARGIPPTTQDYASALTAGLATSAWTVFCDSNAPAVQSLLASHVAIASSAPYGRWRRGFTGSSIGDSVSQTIVNAVGLDSLGMNYLYPGVYVTNQSTGQNTLYGGLYAAAMAAGMATGNPVATPLTNKPLNATGIENANAGTQLTDSQLVQLQNAGVMAVWTPQNTGIPTILSDVTTWQVDDNVENTSSQQVACRYWLAYSVVNAVQPYVGSIAAPIVEANITNALKKALNALIYTGAGSNGVLAAGATTPSWSNIVLTFNGQQQLASITFNATLVSQNRYITCFASVQPLNFTISVTSAGA
jgi:hypothetical protein